MPLGDRRVLRAGFSTVLAERVSTALDAGPARSGTTGKASAFSPCRHRGRVGKICSPTPVEITAGLSWLRRLLDLQSDLRVVAWFGRASARPVLPLCPELACRA